MERDWGKEGKELGDKGEGIYKLYNIVRQIDREEKNYLKKKQKAVKWNMEGRQKEHKTKPQ